MHVTQLRKKPQEEIPNHMKIMQLGMEGLGTQTCKSIDTSLQQLMMGLVTKTMTIKGRVATDTVLSFWLQVFVTNSDRRTKVVSYF